MEDIRDTLLVGAGDAAELLLLVLLVCLLVYFSAACLRKHACGSLRAISL